MFDWLTFVIVLSLFAIPLYLANSLACVFGGGKQLDSGRVWMDKKPVFGKGKTVRGALGGVFFGSLGAAIIWLVFPAETDLLMNNYLLFGFLVSAGAVLGDLAGSFIKRRAGVEQGKEVLLLDQFDFLIGGWVLGAVVYMPGWEEVVAMLIVTFTAHKLGNLIGYLTKVKAVPW